MSCSTASSIDRVPAHAARSSRSARVVRIASALTALLAAAALPAGSPAWFTLVPGALSPQACGGSGCWTNHLRVTDLDGDGDLDILLANYADFFSGNSSPQPLVIYANNGSGSFSNVSAAAVGGYLGNLRQVAVGDVNGDGLPDIYAPQGDGSAPVLFMNQGSLVFADQAATRLPATYPQ